MTLLGFKTILHKKCRSGKNSEDPAENSWVLDLCPAKWKQISKSLIFPTFLVCFPERNNNNACSLCKKKLTTACDQHRSIQFLLLTYIIYFSYAISLTDYKKFLKIAGGVKQLTVPLLPDPNCSMPENDAQCIIPVKRTSDHSVHWADEMADK
jgi:hypothetical protein